MPAAQLLELARSGKYEAFESRCVELLADGQLSLGQLIAPFEMLEKTGYGEKLVALLQTVLENTDAQADPASALALSRVALIGSPKNEEFRRAVVQRYRDVHAGVVHFDAVLEASGLAGGRPVRMALKHLDFCLALQPGDVLIGRADDRVVEVVEIDLQHALFTIRRDGRPSTLPVSEVVRDYDRVSADDFRVIRQLRPERVSALLEENPVAVVIGVLHAHGEHIDTDQLKDELVPRFISEKDWSAWWTRARTALRKSPHIIIEGRSPVILRFSPQGQTLEDETWETLQREKEPARWLATVESYVREKVALKETPDQAFVSKMVAQIEKQARALAEKRPVDALAAGLALLRLADKGLPVSDEGKTIAADVLRQASRPLYLLEQIESEALRERLPGVLREARPDDWADIAVAWMPTAPASLLDALASAAIEAGRHDRVQAILDAALDEAATHPQLMYWLWKGPKVKGELNFPGELDLFRLLLDTLSALGRTVAAEPAIVKEFRHTVKAAFGLKDYARVKRCLEQCGEDAAIVIKRQLQRLEGVGPNVQARMLELLREVHPVLWVVKRRHVEPWADPETLWTTAAGLTRRAAERDEIVNVQMRENARRIGEAASLGDLSENSEYKFALEERDLLRARLAAINDELSRARKIEPRDVPETNVGVGSRVRLRSGTDGSERIMTFLGPFDTDVERGIYSYQAPVSQKLMGRSVGDRVIVTVDGRDIEYEVLAIENALLDLPQPQEAAGSTGA